MYMTYRMKAEELDSRFLRALKAMFKDKEIEISVCEAAQTEEDETAYLVIAQPPAWYNPLDKKGCGV